MQYFRDNPVKLGISSCLLGESVRYDGGHREHVWLVRELGRHVTWLSVCPEVELGLGVPRETIGLVRWSSARSPGPAPAGRPGQRADEIRLIANRTKRDLTAAMAELAARRLEDLAAAPISGYVFKARSPSCGIRGVNVLDPRRAVEPEPVGTGLFARALMKRFPELPVVDDSELDREAARTDFIARIRAYHRRRERGPV